MDNIKNAIIALLTGLLALTLFTQSAQSAPDTYDAVKLVQYERCLDRLIKLYGDRPNVGLGDFDKLLAQCLKYKP